MRIALAQINPTVGDLKGNSEKIVEYVGRALQAQADIVVFPELALCGYPPEDLLLKKHFIDDNIKALRQLSKRIVGIKAVVGFVNQDKKGKLFNAAALIENRAIEGVYHKQCLPNYGVFDEKRYFEVGKEKGIFALGGKDRMAISICEDLWQDVCPRQAKGGAKLLINISSSPYDVGKLKKRETLIKALAKQTKTYVAYCNIVGGQDELIFDGNSFVVGPQGRTIAMAREFEEDLLVADIPLGRMQKNRKSVPEHFFLPSSKIERIYKALVLGVRDYTRKNNFKKVLIGLSGGIDSSLVAAIAVEALGQENVIGVTMPSRYSSTGTRTDAKKLADNLNIALKEIPIEEVVTGYQNVLKSEFANAAPNSAEENIQARIRGNLLMALSNKFNWLVLTTGNKSEFAVGYCTLYGDMSGGFAVIKDVPKTIVYELCLFINQKKGDIIPASVITRAPTAELRENQTDQDTLPPYALLDEMLREYVEDHRSLAQMAKAKDPRIIKKFISMVDGNEYKRRQAPPGIKITPRAFGKDWRLPITNKYREF
jgi:NAD+ synthase (glutamine-hydrolysing)